MKQYTLFFLYSTLFLCVTLSHSQSTPEITEASVSSIELRKNIDALNSEKEKRLKAELSEIDHYVRIANQHLSELAGGPKRIATDKNNWKKFKESALYALEDETFVPGSQNFAAFRAGIKDRIVESNQRVSSQAVFLSYYQLGVYQRRSNEFDAVPALRDNDPSEIKDLIKAVDENLEKLAELENTIAEQGGVLFLNSLRWEEDYRSQLFDLRGSMINEVIVGGAFALNNIDPLMLELNSLTSNFKFYFFKKSLVDRGQNSAKHLITFSFVREVFKLCLLAGFIIALVVFRRRLFAKLRKWTLSKQYTRKWRLFLLGCVDLSRELFIFLILLLIGQLLIKVLVRAGVDFANLFTPILNVVVIFFLVLGAINFITPKLSHRARREVKNVKEVLAMETVFKLVPTVYLLYWLTSGVLQSVLLQALNQSLLEFYGTKLLVVLFSLVLLVCIWFERNEWRLVNDKATRSEFWMHLSQRSLGRLWEPLVLLAGGGLGVYRVAWRILAEQLTEVEMAKRFQAMYSRALLERQYRKSMRIIDQAWFPEHYWLSFSFQTPAETSWYVRREEPEVVLQEALKRWQQEQRGHRVLLCGDRGVGKSELIRKFCAANQIEALRVELKVGNTSISGLCEQFSKTLLTDVAANDPESLVDAINRLPASVISLENFENTMLRKVGGFDGFAFVLDLVLQTSHRHYWLCTCTSFAWTIAKQAVTGSNCFSDLIEVKGMTETQLRTLILNRHFANNNKAPDFGLLSTSIPETTHSRSGRNVWSSQEQEEKNTELYFRILWDYTRGNPRQALYFWKSSLQWSDDLVSVQLFEVPEQRVLENLADSTLMLLAALIEHNGLTQEGLAEIMNISHEAIRRRLEELAPYNVLYRIENGELTGWHIESFWVRAVENYLEKRQFLFRGKNL